MNSQSILVKSLLTLVAGLCLMFAIAPNSDAQIQVEEPVIVEPWKGPCVNPPFPPAIIPPACDVDCVVFCSDPQGAAVGHPGNANCMLEEGPCNRQLHALSNQYARECACTWPFGGCVDLGLYPVGAPMNVLLCA